jgi:hypothetical protein
MTSPEANLAADFPHFDSTHQSEGQQVTGQFGLTRLKYFFTIQ